MRLSVVAASLCLVFCACEESRRDAAEMSPPSAPTGTQLIRETLSGTISAVVSPACSTTFEQSVHPDYYSGGLRRCVEFSHRSETSGMIIAELRWEDRRIDLDMVLNDGAGSNFRQSIAANRAGERVEFFVNGGTRYVFVIYLRGVDPIFLANGGRFAGEITTPFTLTVERPR